MKWKKGGDEAYKLRPKIIQLIKIVKRNRVRGSKSDFMERYLSEFEGVGVAPPACPAGNMGMGNKRPGEGLWGWATTTKCPRWAGRRGLPMLCSAKPRGGWACGVGGQAEARGMGKHQGKAMVNEKKRGLQPRTTQAAHRRKKNNL